MVLGQPTPSFALAVDLQGSNVGRDVEFIITNKRPRSRFKAPSAAYNLLVQAFGTDDTLFTREEALDILAKSGFRNEGTFLFDDLLEQDSIQKVT